MGVDSSVLLGSESLPAEWLVSGRPAYEKTQNVGELDLRTGL